MILNVTELSVYLVGNEVVIVNQSWNHFLSHCNFLFFGFFNEWDEQTYSLEFHLDSHEF